MKGSVKIFLSSEEGSNAIEYALTASSISLAILTGVSALGISAENLFGTLSGSVYDAVNN